SEGEKIKEAELLIDPLDLPCDILSEYASFNSQDFTRDDVLFFPYNVDKVKEYQEKDKIRSKPDKNEKRGEAGKSPQEEEDDMKIYIEEYKNEPELTYPYEEVDPLNPPPSASESKRLLV
nr:hypothetical protein [Tanacetum cinerariifolium]